MTKSLLVSFLFCLITSSVYAGSSHIVVQNLYFPKPGKEKAAYQLRVAASNTLEKLGVPTLER